MEKTLKIVNLALRIIALLILALTTILSMISTYIVLAPDEFPKPFRLVYQYPSTSSLSIVVGAPAPTQVKPSPTPIIMVKPGEGLMQTMSTKILNLAGSDGRRYIRTTVVLEFQPQNGRPVEKQGTTPTADSKSTSADPNAELEAQISARMPLMDDLVITILSGKTYEDLYTSSGKEALRKEIMDTINERLPEFHILSVYFTEFVVQ